MANVEDRVVSMAFENTKFQAGISQTMASMDKFNAALQKLGAQSGLDNIEKSANKISLTGPMSALDKLKAKFGRGVPEADQAFSEVEKSSGKVGFLGIGTAIDKLKGKFNFPEADQAFASVEKSSGRVTFSGLTQALDGLGNKFGVVEGIASVALGNIASQAAMRGAAMTKSLTLGPIQDGYKEYETNLNSIQTILANTQASGAKLKDVQAALSELNTYSDKTIYNFSEMAKNIGTFTAAGVDLKTATASIKGIANLAAVSGSNSQQASTAMYQLSQAISSGRVSLQDWNSVVNAGMGGTVFQRALAQTAQKMGTLKDGAVKLSGKMKNVTVDGKSFRESVMSKPGEQSWLTSKVLTTTLKHFTGDLTDAQLAAEGFSKQEIKAIQAQAKTAQEAATHVKTLSALLDTTKEQIGSGWANTMQLIFGDFHTAPKLFTSLSNAIGGFVSDNAKARNKILSYWGKHGGRTVMLEGLKQAFYDLKAVIQPVRDGFRDIFPAMTGKRLVELSGKFLNFMEKLQIGTKTGDELRRIFRGLFAVLDIGKQIVGGIFTAIGHLLGAVGKGSGGLLHFVGNVGDLVVALDQWLKKGNKLHDFFATIGDILATPIHLLGVLSDKIGAFFGGAEKTTALHDSIAGVGDALKPASKAADTAERAWSKFLGVLDKVRDAMGTAVSAIGDAFGQVGEAVSNALSHQSFDGVFKVIQTGLIAGIFLTIKKALGGGLNINFGQNALKGISGVLDTLNGSLKAIQTNIKAHTLTQIAIALALLTGSAVALSLVKPEKLASAMTAMAVGLGQLVGAMALLSKMGGEKAWAKAPIAATGLIAMAAAVDVLSIAIIALSHLSPKEMATGLVGITGGLTILTAAAIPLSKVSPQLVIAGVGITAVSTAMVILGGAMKIFASMSWEQLGKGLAGVTVALIGIAGAMQLMPLNLPITAAGLLILSVALTAITGAVAIFGHMDLKTLGKGIGAIAVALVAIGAAMQLMPITLPLTAAGLVLVGVALTAISGAVALLGNMDMSTLAKGIGAIAAMLVVLAGGLTLMVASLPGAAALIVAAGALAILAPVIGLLGSMKFSTIAKGLGAIAATFAVLAIGGALAAAPLAALGVALAVLGVGVLALGAGVKLLASGVAVLADKGAKGFAVFVGAITALILILPKLVIDFVKGLVEIVSGIAKLAPDIVKSLVTVAGLLVTAIIALAPKAAVAITALLTAMVQVLDRNAGPLIKAGWNLLTKLLGGISGHIGDVTRKVGDIVAKFLSALGSKMPSIISGGVKVLTGLLKGIGDNLSKVAEAGATLITKYIGAIAKGASKLVSAGVDLVVKIVSGIGNNLGKVITAGVSLVSKLLTGIENNAERLVHKAVDLVIKFANSIAHEAHRLVDAGGKLIVKVLNGIADSINKYEPQIIQASIRIGAAIVTGAIKGIGGSLGALKSKVEGMASSAIGWFKHKIGAKSPSTEFATLGGYMMQGLGVGIDTYAPAVRASMFGMGQGLIDTVKNQFQIRSPSQVMYNLGQFIGQGFRDGLKGSSEDIDKAFTDLTTKIQSSYLTAQKRAKTEHEALKKLLDAKHPNKKAIEKEREELESEINLVHRLHSAHTLMIKGLDDQKGKLKAKADEYASVADKLEKAKSKLDQLQSDKEGLISSTIDQYSTLPDIVKETTDAEGNTIPVSDQLGPYVTALGNAVTAVSTYSDTLDQLRKLGLDDATYRKLLTEGPADQAFANQLLAGGKTAVDSLNALDTQLAGVSGNLANAAAANLYNAGIQAAQGLVKGLQSQENQLRKAMEKIATAMIKAIRKKLHIKSPSREFEEIGKLSTEGMAVGLDKGSKMVSDIASSVGENALDAMRSSIRDMSKSLNAEIDTDPTIKPVLDLSQVKEQAKKMADLTNIPAAAVTSFGQATSISGAERARLETLAAETGPPVLNFEQTLNSPKALSESEVYRQTRNQLSQAKDALGL